jgi:hypothetical protein
MSTNETGEGSLEKDGWALLSAEQYQGAHPGFLLPSLDERASVRAGQAVKLLFDIETREKGRVIDGGLDRMWVIIRRQCEGGYVGVLDSDPGLAENIRLRPEDEVSVGPEHITEIDSLPLEYLMKRYGADCFDD